MPKVEFTAHLRRHVECPASVVDGATVAEALRSGLPQHQACDPVYRHALDVDATGTRLAFGSTTGGLWVSGNGGDEWTEPSAHLPPVHVVRFGP